MFTQGDFDYEKEVFITGEDFGKLYKTNHLCRYQKKFEEEVFIAGGGFGKVYKARHCLDEKEYAIKKITVERITEWQLNEVRTLAALNHPNIIPYHTAWIESSSPYTSNASSTNSICSSKCYRRDSKSSSPLAIKDSFNNEYDLNLNKTKIHHNKTDILFDINAFCKTDTNMKMKKSNKVHKNDDNNINSNTISVTFEDSSANIIDEKIVEKNTIKEYYTAESSSNVVFFQNSKINDRCEKLDLTNNIKKKVEENTTKESSSDGVSFRNSKSNESPDQAIVNASTSSSCEESSREVNIYTSNKNTSYTLYIQMALCEQTLEQWLRDKMSVTPESIVKTIFQQIVCGVDYMHSQKIVHHDIKPSNIFMTTSGQLRVQLGDFGLACPLQKERHSVIGTHIYTAPEQLQAKCDPKSDIYSIGVVFIELAISIKTRMELTDIIKSLRSGEVPETLKQHKWAQMIQRLVQEDPTNRPSASQLLQDFNHDKNVTIHRLENTIVHLENNNNKKDDKIQNLLQENALLKEKIQELSRTMQQSKLVHEN